MVCARSGSQMLFFAADMKIFCRAILRISTATTRKHGGHCVPAMNNETSGLHFAHVHGHVFRAIARPARVLTPGSSQTTYRAERWRLPFSPSRGIFINT